MPLAAFARLCETLGDDGSCSAKRKTLLLLLLLLLLFCCYCYYQCCSYYSSAPFTTITIPAISLSLPPSPLLLLLLLLQFIYLSLLFTIYYGCCYVYEIEYCSYHYFILGVITISKHHETKNSIGIYSNQLKYLNMKSKPSLSPKLNHDFHIINKFLSML